MTEDQRNKIEDKAYQFAEVEGGFSDRLLFNAFTAGAEFALKMVEEEAVKKAYRTDHGSLTCVEVRSQWSRESEGSGV